MFEFNLGLVTGMIIGSVIMLFSLNYYKSKFKKEGNGYEQNK